MYKFEKGIKIKNNFPWFPFFVFSERNFSVLKKPEFIFFIPWFNLGKEVIIIFLYKQLKHGVYLKKVGRARGDCVLLANSPDQKRRHDLFNGILITNFFNSDPKFARWFASLWKLDVVILKDDFLPKQMIIVVS